MRFEPQPNDIVHIGPDTFKVAPHPGAPRMAFGQEGRKSTVYQLGKASNSQCYALKIFKAAFRDESVIVVAKRIAQYAILPGMMACERIVLTRDSHGRLLMQYPELEYGVLMPWVGGRTWQDIILAGVRLSREESWILAQRTAAILSRLEEEGLAHCDIASGNVLISITEQHVGLVDLEDIYGPALSPPSACPQGSAGHQHRVSRTNDQGQWGPEGDRFSGAILLAEILAWQDPRIPRKADQEHYFEEEEMQDATCERYALMREALQGMSGGVAELLERTWLSQSLGDCPTLVEWAQVIARGVEAQQALRRLEMAITRGSGQRILAIWNRHQAVLSDFPEAQKYRTLADLAARRFNVHEQMEKRAKENEESSEIPTRVRWMPLIGGVIAVCLVVCLWLGTCLVVYFSFRNGW